MFRIKEILKEKGITQTELAEKIGITQVGLNKMINGNPTAETLLKISEAIDVDIRDLFVSTKETDTLYIKDKAGKEKVVGYLKKQTPL